VDVERVTEVSLRAVDHAGRGGRFRALMRNGDSLLVTDRGAPLRLRVADRPMEIEARRVERVEFDESGERATITLVGGDSLAGQIGGARVEFVLVAGPHVSVHPGTVRSLVRTEP